MSPPSLGTALVTGASSGIGKVYAERLAARGYDLILVARRIDRLESLAHSLSQVSGRKVSILKADLGQRADVSAVEGKLTEDSDITLLVNNAGISLEGNILTVDAAAIEQIIAVNTTAPTLLLAAAAKAFVARRRGAIINIASVLAYAPEQMEGIYSGTKSHLINITLGLVPLLAETGVRVQVVLPGATRTEIWDSAGKDPDVLLPGKVMNTTDLVDAALLGFDRGEIITIPPLHDESRFLAVESARKALTGYMSNKEVAPRYRS